MKEKKIFTHIKNEYSFLKMKTTIDPEEQEGKL